MEKQKCMWCLKEIDFEHNSKYCSKGCQNKNDRPDSDSAVKKGFFSVIGDIAGSLLS